MRLKVFTLLALVNIATAFPAKLLRVPKIYNALITSKEKILPSEAYPATTGPIFQPIGLPGDPILINPALIIAKPNQQSLGLGCDTCTRAPTEAGGPMRKSKPPAPITFYPRYSVYYAHQPYLTLQQPILYTAFEVPNPPQPPNNQRTIPKELEVEERKDFSFQSNKMKLAMPQEPSVVEYVKNNRPADRNIPDIPPPPPPVRFRDIDEESR